MVEIVWHRRETRRQQRRQTSTCTTRRTRSTHQKFGPDFSGETFRVLKDKEEREFGEYRPRHLVLKAWDINKPSLPWVLLINKV